MKIRKECSKRKRARDERRSTRAGSAWDDMIGSFLGMMNASMQLGYD